MKVITREDYMPRGKHFAILEFSSRRIPGDDRSRHSPGHGYPEHTEQYSTYSTTENEAEWKREIAILTERKKEFVAFRAGPLATITFNVEVKIEQ